MNHPLNENLVMLAELTIKPGKIDEFLDYTTRNLDLSRSYPGNIQFDILIDEDLPERVFFYEVWQSAEAQQAYMAWRIQVGDLTRLMSLLAGEPRFMSLRVVASSDRSS